MLIVCGFFSKFEFGRHVRMHGKALPPQMVEHAHVQALHVMNLIKFQNFDTSIFLENGQLKKLHTPKDNNSTHGIRALTF